MQKIGRGFPITAHNARGDTVAASWTEGGLVVRSRKAGGTWSAPKAVFPPDGIEQYDVGIDGRGQITVAMTRGHVGTERLSVWVRSQTGSGWGKPVQLSSTVASTEVNLAVSAGGAAAVGFNKSFSGTRAAHVAYRRAGGIQWLTPKRLAGETWSEPVLGMDAEGRAFAVWSTQTSTDSSVRFQSASRSGAWRSERILASGPGLAYYPTLSVTPRGAVSVAYGWRPGSSDQVSVLNHYRRVGGDLSNARTLATMAVGTADITHISTVATPTWTAVTGWVVKTASGDEARLSRMSPQQVWSSAIPVASGPRIFQIDVRALAGQQTAVIYGSSDNTTSRRYSRILSASGALGAEEPLEFSDAVSASPAGDVVVATQYADGIGRIRVLDSAGPMTSARSSRTALSKRVNVSWSAVDAWSKVAGYTALRISATATGRFGPYRTWLTTTKKSGAFNGVPGSTYCFKVRAADTLGNPGASSAERCTAVPVDDRGLRASAGWSRTKKAGSYLGTVTQTSTKGRSLSKSVRVKRLELVAAKCPSCGVVDVFLGKIKLKRISLKGTSRQRVLIPVKTFEFARSGEVRIVVASSGKTVVIDGLASSQAGAR